MDEAGSRSRTFEPEIIRNTEKQLQKVTRERYGNISARAYEQIAPTRLREIALKSRLNEQLSEWQHSPKVIDVEDIECVITSLTGIPAEKVSRNEAERLKSLNTYLQSRVVGQAEAVERVTRTLQRSRAGLKDANRPIGVFMFVGPTGVGKTLLAKELSQWLFDNRRGLIRIDMSEYGEKHNVSRLIGSPPGYIGYGEGGQLTEAVRRQPYAVILFDEIEKAHPNIFNTMLQIFDEGHLTDGTGRKVDFRNTVIIMTSNVGSRNITERVSQVGFNTPSKDNNIALTPNVEYRKALERTFAPEFLNRIDDIVCFRSLSLDDIEQIIELEIGKILVRASAMGYNVKITPEAKRRLATLGYESRYGARALRRTLLEHIEEPLSSLIINGELTSGREVTIDDNGEQGVSVQVA
jgi:ATP-dependent Clp protease ATP-binding subunit ClpC